MSRHCARGAAALCLLFLAVGPSVAQSVTPRGSELQISTYTQDLQFAPAVAFFGDGDFIVAWTTYGPDGDDFGVFARRFDSNGTRQASEFQVNSYTEGDQRYPAVAVRPQGDFVIAWTSKGQDGTDYGIFARRFDSAGAALAVEFQVNTYTQSQENYPAVQLDGGGGFVVVWSGLDHDGYNFGIFARRFDSAGAAQGVEFQVNTRTAFSQNDPALVMDGDGDFVVVWSSVGGDGHLAGIAAQRFSSAGVAQASEFQVNTYSFGTQINPGVAVDADGDFVVAWQSYDQDGSNYGVFARRFDSAGTPQASEFQVHTYTSLGQRDARIASDDDGDFVVSWTSYQDGSDSGVFARRFDASGAPQAAPFQVNTYTIGHQRIPAIATDGDAHFLVAWQSTGQDGGSDGVFARRLGPPAVLDVDDNGSLSALTDGLLVLRFHFGFSGATLTAAVLGAGCNRCDAGVISTYLAGLGATLDIDGNGSLGALTDGLLVLRFLFGFTGATLTNGVVDTQGCTRCDATTIVPYFQTLI